MPGDGCKNRLMERKRKMAFIVQVSYKTVTREKNCLRKKLMVASSEHKKNPPH
jgi:hypothetical protein